MDYEQDTEASNRFLKGYNDGYLMAQHLPDMADTLAQTDNVAPWFEGFREGHHALVLEQVQENRPEWLKESPKETPQEPPKDKDRDIEPDR